MSISAFGKFTEQGIRKRAKPEVHEKAPDEPTRPISNVLSFPSPATEFRKHLRKRFIPVWVGEIITEVSARHGVFPTEIMSKARSQRIVKARNEVFYLIKACKPEISTPQIGRWFGRDHTGVLHSIASHADATGSPKLYGYDLDGVRRRNAAVSEEIRRRKKERT